VGGLAMHRAHRLTRRDAIGKAVALIDIGASMDRSRPCVA
jgi:hypothetical protein